MNPALAAVRAPARSVSVPVVGQTSAQQASQAPQPQVPANNATWNDLVSLQGQSANASLPLQYTPASFNTPTASTSLPMSIPGASQLNVTNPYTNLSASPASALPSSFTQTTGISPGGFGRSMSLNSGLSVQAPMATGISPNFNNGLNASPLMQSNMNLGQNQMMTPGHQTPSPNPFVPQALSQMQNSTGMSMNSAFSGMTGMSMQQPLQQNFTSQSYQQQSQFQPQQQQQQFQTQPQMTGMSFQSQQQMYQPQPTMFQPTGNTNPFMQMQSQTPQFQQTFAPTPQFGGTPSPMIGMQGLPQMQQPMQMQQQQPQQQQQPNQFTSWIQGPPGTTTGFAGQQQWSGM